MGQRVSMRDVAQRASVSQKTVSRVINDEPHVTDDVRERVTAAIAELGYRRNEAARALVTRRTRQIGIVSLGATTLYGPTGVLAAVEIEAERAGYSIAVTRTTPGSGSEIQEAVDAFVAQGVEALVISEPADFGDGPIRVPDAIPVLTFGLEPVTDHPHELVVGADERDGARRATQHLIDAGHPVVHHISGPLDWLSSRNRQRGWRDAMGDAAPEPIEGSWTPESGFAAMSALLERGAEAVFVANDQMAIGAMAAITRAGRRIPKDVAIAGFDDLDISAYLPTSLTSVSHSFEASAREGMRRLIRALAGDWPEDLHHPIPVELEIRASTSRS